MSTDQARRKWLRAHGWSPQEMETWVSHDGKTVMVSRSDGIEAEAKFEHSPLCDIYDRPPEGIVKPCNCNRR
jgi:hypothetical protein